MTDKKGSRDKGSAGLSDDDLALWKHVTKEAQPLKARDKPRPEAPTTVDPETTPEGSPKPKAAAKVPAAAPESAKQQSAKQQPAKPAPPELSHGGVAGVDKRSVERMKRGQLPVEAALDLHGHTQDRAHRALARFLAEAQDRGLRCVLVITGKGVTKEAGGVLRAQVPRWLNEPDNRDKILAFDYAQPKDGGMGALYVLMRRRRG